MKAKRDIQDIEKELKSMTWQRWTLFLASLLAILGIIGVIIIIDMAPGLWLKDTAGNPITLRWMDPIYDWGILQGFAVFLIAIQLTMTFMAIGKYSKDENLSSGFMFGITISMIIGILFGGALITFIAAPVGLVIVLGIFWSEKRLDFSGFVTFNKKISKRFNK